MSESLAWAAVAGLGAYHGLNPAMGWLFAVARGLQERSRGAVLRSLVPIALGHEASVALVVVLASGVALVTAPQLLRVVGACALVAFGLFKLARPRAHPQWVGMRITERELGLWSFLMSSAHGAGLMLFPVLLGLPAMEQGDHAVELSLAAETLVQDVLAVVLHTAAMLVVMGAVAVVVYERLGVGVLRRAWLNLDLVWSVVLIGAGALTLFT